MDRWVKWINESEYTSTGVTFDIGRTCLKAIKKYCNGSAPLQCGSTSINENGNGSLMRILPVCLYLFEQQKSLNISDDEVIDIVHNCSALTHAHIRSKLACGIYYFLVRAVLGECGELTERLQIGIDNAFEYYGKNDENELGSYNRLISLSQFKNTSKELIKSTGYVVYTLEAAIWCLINTSSYKEAVLKAVNLGDDTDTIAAVTGGLAGLYYTYDGIPVSWRAKVQKKNWIDSLLKA